MIEREESSAEFARRTGIDAKQISHILTGFRNMGHAIARRIEEALSMPTGTMDQLIGIARQPKHRKTSKNAPHLNPPRR